MVQAKVTVQMEARDLRILNDALFLYIAAMEERAEAPESFAPAGARKDTKQLEMFVNDSKLRASEARGILNVINIS